MLLTLFQNNAGARGSAAFATTSTASATATGQLGSAFNAVAASTATASLSGVAALATSTSAFATASLVCPSDFVAVAAASATTSATFVITGAQFAAAVSAQASVSLNSSAPLSGTAAAVATTSLLPTWNAQQSATLDVFTQVAHVNYLGVVANQKFPSNDWFGATSNPFWNLAGIHAGTFDPSYQQTNGVASAIPSGYAGYPGWYVNEQLTLVSNNFDNYAPQSQTYLLQRFQDPTMTADYPPFPKSTAYGGSTSLLSGFGKFKNTSFGVAPGSTSNQYRVDIMQWTSASVAHASGDIDFWFYVDNSGQEIWVQGVLTGGGYPQVAWEISKRIGYDGLYVATAGTATNDSGSGTYVPMANSPGAYPGYFIGALAFQSLASINYGAWNHVHLQYQHGIEGAQLWLNGVRDLAFVPNATSLAGSWSTAYSYWPTISVGTNSASGIGYCAVDELFITSNRYQGVADGTTGGPSLNNLYTVKSATLVNLYQGDYWDGIDPGAEKAPNLYRYNRFNNFTVPAQPPSNTQTGPTMASFSTTTTATLVWPAGAIYTNAVASATASAVGLTSSMFVNPAAVATASAALTTQVKLAEAATAVATATAALSTAIQLAGAVGAVATTNATFPGIFAGALNAVATVSATPSSDFSSTVSAVASTNAAMAQTQAALVASVAAVATAGATGMVVSVWAGAATAVASSTPNLTTSIRLSVTSDPFAGNVQALLHFDGANGSTTFTDEAGGSWALVGTGVSNSTANKKFGSASLVDGGAGYLNMASPPSRYDFRSGAFTVDFWGTATSWASVPSFLAKASGTSGIAYEWAMEIDGTNSRAVFYHGIRGTNQSQILFPLPITPALNTWYHFEMSRSATGVWRLFMNGVQSTAYQYAALAPSLSFGAVTPGNLTNAVDLGATVNPLSIGGLNVTGSGSNMWTGNIDEMRITVGVERHSSNFTPPTFAAPAYDGPRAVATANAWLLINNGYWVSDVTATATATADLSTFGPLSMFGAATASASFTVPYVTDIYAANEVLWLRGEGGSIVDSSPIGSTISNTGITQSSAQAVYGTQSLFFPNVAADGLQITTLAPFVYGTQDFTFEAWVYPTANAIMGYIAHGSQATTNPYFYQNGLVPTWYYNNTGVSVGPSVTLNQWNHVAFVRSGSLMTVFTNGVAGTPSSHTDSFTCGYLVIGQNGANAQPFAGYMDEMRITKGVARYLTNFTPNAPFSDSPFGGMAGAVLLTGTGILTTNAVAQATATADLATANSTLSATAVASANVFSPIDPMYSSTTLLVHADGWNNASVITDDSTYNRTVTNLGTPKTVTSTFKVNGSSMFLDGASAITVPADINMAPFGNAASVANTYGCLELWFNHTSTVAYPTLACNLGAVFAAGMWSMTVNPSGAGTLGFALANFSTSAQLLTSTSTNLNDGKWHHVAVTLQGGGIYTLFIDGIQQATATFATAVTMSAYPTAIGKDPVNTRFFPGYIDEVRMTKGSVPAAARYLKNFVPSSLRNPGRNDFLPGANLSVTAAFAGATSAVATLFPAMPTPPLSSGPLSVLSGVGTVATASASLSVATGFATTAGAQATSFADLATRDSVLSATATAVASTGTPTDPYLSLVTSLLHGEGSNGATVFTDESPAHRALALTGTIVTSNTNAKFGFSSMLVTGTTSYLADTYAGYAFGTGEYTVECWVYPTATSANSVIYDGNSADLAGDGPMLRFSSTNLLGGVYIGSGGNIGQAAVTINAWHHIAMSRSAGTVYVFVDGVMVGSAASAQNLTSTKFTLGDLTTRGALSFPGYIDEFRITKGKGRYTPSNPPSLGGPFVHDPTIYGTTLTTGVFFGGAAVAQVSTSLFYAPPNAQLVAAPAAVATTTADLTTTIQLAASVAAQASTPTATLAGVSAALVGAPAALASTTAGLSTQITLAAAPAGLATTSAALTTGIALAAAPSALATATTALTTSIQLAATPGAVASVTATLAGGAALMVATATSVASTTAGLTTVIKLATATTAVATANATGLSGAAALATALAAVATANAVMTTAIQAAAASSALATGSASLTTQVRLNAAVTATAVVAADILTAIRLGASPAAFASAAATGLQGSNRIGTGTASASSTFTAWLYAWNRTGPRRVISPSTPYRVVSPVDENRAVAPVGSYRVVSPVDVHRVVAPVAAYRVVSPVDSASVSRGTDVLA